MSHWRLRLGVVAVLVLAFVVPGRPQLAAADPTIGVPSAATLARVNTYLQAEVSKRGLPGAELAIVDGQSILDLTAIGEADAAGRKLTPQTPVLLASLSKNLTATAIMQLVETGKVRLDAPVTAYLPWFVTADRAASAAITVAELLHHTSGIPVVTPSETGAIDDDSPAALERGIRRLDHVRLASAPGSAFLYSNTNYNILGLVVQTVSGEPFADYLSRHIFAPAGMQYASVGPHPRADAARGFYPWFGGPFRQTSIPEPASMMPSAITYCSAADLAQVLIMNMNDGRVGAEQILSPASVAQLHQPAFPEDDFTAYAMGWMVRPGWEFVNPTELDTTIPLPVLIDHQGTWPNTRTFLGFLPEPKLGIALLLNANQPSRETELNAIYDGIWRIIAGQQPHDEPASEDFLTSHGWQLGVAILVLLIGSLAWSLALVRRPRPGRATRTRRRRFVLGGMLVLDLAVVAFLWLYLPSAYDTTTLELARFNPDLGILLLAAAILTFVWAPIRTVLGLVRLRAAGASGAPRQARR